MAKVHTIIATKHGEQVSFDREPAAVLSFLKDGRYVMTIRREDEPRSIDQNALMWLWFTCIEAETGTDKQDVHDYFCRRFLQRRVTWKGRRKMIAGGTSGLTKEKMTTFLDKVQAETLTEFGIRLPMPEERFFEEFYQMYK